MQVIISLLPIVWLVITLGVFKWPVIKAATSGLLITFVLALLASDLSLKLTTLATLDGVAMGLVTISYVVISALFSYNLSVYSGGIGKIEAALAHLSQDYRILVLILCWSFGAFLESVAGFGIAVAIPAGMLISMGVKPLKAASVSLLANTATTAFGAVGLPVITLADVTKLNVQTLATYVSIELLLACILVPFLLIYLLTESWKQVFELWQFILVSGLTYGVVQLIIAYFMGSELPTIVASLVTLLVQILLVKRKDNSISKKINLIELIPAVLPFILIFVLVLVTSPVFPTINQYLNIQLIFTIYPKVSQTFNLLTSPGTLILIATVIGGLTQRISLQEQGRILFKTIQSSFKTVITICAIVGLAKIMDYSGMTTNLADFLVTSLGPIYPLVAPIIGALGSFATGSNTSSNVLFGELQLTSAKDLAVNKYWLVASNMAGSTAGSMLSPQSIAVASATSKQLRGREGEILATSIKWALIYLGFICLSLFILGLTSQNLHF
ncbi:L-lactate permease [Lactobacillus psittaci]|uniref:L-lactate permease n=1 Tax=Lactobacillus psittaci DSM 15354 TaxID=1122152 RepID=A0A0R1S2X9_9LACO|nr:L-lactate permease [Lactobacillus psittaci]KRL63356.1 lactate premease [Lactobacillus psittaci DSM 15354]